MKPEEYKYNKKIQRTQKAAPLILTLAGYKSSVISTYNLGIIMPIKRYFEDQYFERIEKDFTFLVQIIKDFKGELELAFRENYFNLYYRGNSVAKIVLKKDEYYEIFINDKFYPDCLKNDSRFSLHKSGAYNQILIKSDLLHPFFQKKYLQELFSKIKQVNYSEELIFEQMLITDNLENENIIIIDRQITDKKLNRKRMDLLALKQVRENEFNFVVLEVKMGNNPELKSKVAEQIGNYIKHRHPSFLGLHFSQIPTKKKINSPICHKTFIR